MKPQALNSNRTLPIFSKTFKFLAGIALILLLTSRVAAQDADYLRIFETIQQADTLATTKPAAALEKYRQAYAELSKIRQNDRTYKPDLISYRLNDVSKKMTACAEKLNASTNTTSASASVGSAGQGQSSSTANTTAKGITKPVVKLLDQGSAPQKLLRLQPKEGDQQTLILTSSVSMDAGPLTNLPAVKETSRVTITAVSAQGDIEYERVLTDLSMASGSGPGLGDPDAINKVLSTMKGTTMSGVLSSRGFALREETKASPSSGKQQMPAIIRLATAVGGSGLDSLIILPEEAVGPGSKWETTVVGKSSVQKVTSEIVSIDGSKITVKQVVAISEQTEKTKGTGLKGKGTGELIIDLAQIVPLRGKFHIEMEGNAPGGNSMKIRNEISIEAR